MRLTLTLRQPDGSVLYEADLPTTMTMIDSSRAIMDAALAGHGGAARVIHDARDAAANPTLPPRERGKSLVAMCMLYETFLARRLGQSAPAVAAVAAEGPAAPEAPAPEGDAPAEGGACCRACELGGTCEKGPPS